jgi:hypothetical protein
MAEKKAAPKRKRKPRAKAKVAGLGPVPAGKSMPVDLETGDLVDTHEKRFKLPSAKGGKA